jgi:hypothetical protein
MAQDNKIIASLSPADLVVLLQETAGIAVIESSVADGRPVIQAAVKAVNAQTGEVLAGGLPFSVVMFKGSKDTGYTNIAIGTVVPAAELDIHLPRDYFNFCNQRLRFVRVFPLDAGSFVIQMDLMLRNATREYVKFNFGVWGMLFQQVLYELLGSGRESLVHAAEVYAATDVAQQYVATVTDQCVAEAPSDAEPLAPAPEAIVESEAPQTLPEAALIAEPQAEAALEPEAVEQSVEDHAALPAKTVETVPSEAAEETHDFESRSENVMMLADPAEGKDEPELLPDHPVDAEAFAVTLLEPLPVTETAKE